MDRLPIDDVMPAILDRVRTTKRLVLEAPPGAGKTTRVPIALLDAGLAGEREIVVLEPRRIAARAAARRVASERGERLGDTVGFQVRFEDVSGPRTRLRYVTEGILARRMVSDPTLARVGAVLLDEFHERHLAGDVALARCLRLQATTRPDLVVGAMSATLDAKALVDRMGAASLVRSEGRAFPVEIEHAAVRDERPLEVQVAAAVSRAVAAGKGDVLVFLPGAAEIRRASDALRGLASSMGLLVLPLHGELPPDDQDRALRRADRRRVVLSTNVAETSVTVEGVTAVIDSGLARIASVDAWSGLPELRVEKIARDSAAQRAGRAGRTAPGRCLRLFTKPDHDARPEHGIPEIRRLDLAETVLELRAAGEGDPAAFPWFEAPPTSALAAAGELLTRLGAIDASGEITAVGRSMLAFPLPPRLARLVVAAAELGVLDEGVAAAALLGERDLLRISGFDGRGRSTPRGAIHDTASSDLLPRLDALDEAVRVRFDPDRLRGLGLDLNSARAVARAREQIDSVARRTLRPAPSPPSADEALAVAVLLAFPDRVAARRKSGERELVLSGGGTAVLAEESVVRDAEFLVAIAADERPRGGPLVRIASAVDPDQLMDRLPERVREEVVTKWVADGERVEALKRLVYDGIPLEERRVSSEGVPAVTDRLFAEAQRVGARVFEEAGAVDRLLARSAFVASLDAGHARPLTEIDVDEALRTICLGRSSFAQLRDASLIGALEARLDGSARAALARLAPERVVLHAGWSPRVEYAAGRPPWIEAMLQDFFGLAKGPAVGGGRVAVVLHLLGPNRRPMQVTSDLEGFWERHYPTVRKELSRRYPRHDWPDDPRTATPSHKAPRRRRG